ncbi:protein kinase [bacterium]|nr:protein kinase [bacterium]
MTPQEFERFLARLYASTRSRGDGSGTDELLTNQASEVAETDESHEVFRFGPFELNTEIGRGGFGIVYLARDTRTGTDVALKLPMPFVLMSQTARHRFVREGRVGVTLEHPGIVKVLETGEFGGIVYIASEFVTGPTLSTWLADRKTPVPCRIGAMLVGRMADALAHAHANGVIHRDMKPANVILQPTGNSGESGSGTVCPFQPRVTDFGLAKVLNEIRDEQTLTGSAEIGSTAYMAPEQVLGLADAIGPCTDIHAMGAILYRILAGQAPFPGQSREEVLRKIVHEIPPSLRTIRPDVPEELEIICDKCLRKDPASRYASAIELKSDIQRFLDRESILARPMSYFERGRIWARRHPAIATAATTAVAFMMVVIVIQAMQNRRLRQINRELEISEDRAEVQTILAERRKSIVDRSYYETRLNSAFALSQSGLAVRAQQALTEIDPGPGRRDFAWNHLWMRSREELEVVAFADSDHKLIAVSPDGNTLATFDKARNVVIRDISSGKSLDRFEPVKSSSNIVSLRFSRDGRKLFALTNGMPSDQPGFNEHRFIVRENGNSSESNLRKKTNESILDFVESAEGDRIRFVCNAPASGVSRIDFVSLADRVIGQTPLPHVSNFVRLLPDGRHALVSNKSGLLHVISFDDSEVDIPFAPIRDIVTKSIVIDRTFARIAASSLDRRSVRILMIDPVSGITAKNVDIPFEIEAIRWIEGMESLLLYDSRWNAAIVDVRSGAIVPLKSNVTNDPKSMRLEEVSRVRCISIGKLLLTYGYVKDPGGRSQQAWNLESGEELPFPLTGTIVDAQPLPDGKSALMTNGRLIDRWWPGGRSISNRKLAGHSDEGWGACFAPDDSVLVTSSDDTDDPMTVRVWDWKSGKMIRGFVPHKATVSCVAFSPDGRFIATSALSARENLTLWDAKTGSKVIDLVGHSTPVYNLSFSSDGTRLASGDNKGFVIVWDIATGEAVSNTKADRDRIRGLAFMPGSRTVVATASESRHVRIWDTARKRILQDWETGGEMTTLAFVPNSDHICAAESSGRLFVWDFETGEMIRLIEGDGNRIRHMSFLRDSSFLAAGDVTGQLHLWNVETGIEIFSLHGHEAPVNRVACSSDGNAIATIAHDGSVRLWFGQESR